MDKHELNIGCILHASWLHYFYFSMACWTSCFASHLFQLVVLGRTPNPGIVVYHCISWGAPVLSLLLTYYQLVEDARVSSSSSYDLLIPWCGRNSDDIFRSPYGVIGKWQRFGAVYIPLIGIALFNLMLYVMIVRAAYSRTIQHPSQARNVYTRVHMYLGTFCFCSFWGLAYQLLSWIIDDDNDHRPPPWHRTFRLFESLFDPLQPFLNSLVYVSHDQEHWIVRHFPSQCWTRRTKTCPVDDDEEEEEKQKHESLLLHHESSSST